MFIPGNENYGHTTPVHNLFITASFVITKTRKHLTCPSISQGCTVLHPCHGIQVSNKKGDIDLCSSLNITEARYAECKKPISKDHILYDSVFIIFFKW